MKLKSIASLALGLSLVTGQALAAEHAAPTTAAPTPAANVSQLSNQKAKVSYAIGMSIGQNFKTQSIDVDPAVVSQGIADALNPNAKPLMDKATMEKTMAEFQKDLMMKREKMFKEKSAENLKAGTTFLNENKAKPGVKVTANGLQYKVIKAGDSAGTTPTANDLVTVMYEGKLIDGKVFDSSYKRGKPVTFKVSQVIPGWTEALKLMHPGATWEVFIPPKLAYGEHGIGGMIGPNQTLIFKIHLIKINNKADGANAAKTTTAKNS